MIIELVGLPGGGKTTLAKALASKGAVVVPQPGRMRLILSTLKFEYSHPLAAFALATATVLHAPRGMRYSLYVNGYMGSAAKWNAARALSNDGKTAVIDQGHAQLLVSLPGMAPRLLDRLPKPNLLAVVEAPRNMRNARMQERGRTPRSEGGPEAAEAWDMNAERALTDSMPALERSYPQVVHIDGSRGAEESARELLPSV